MHLVNPIIISTLGLGLVKVVLADDLELEANDVPTACQAICRPIVQLTKSCDIESPARRHVRKRGPISRIYRRVPDDHDEDTDDRNDGNITDHDDDGHLTDNEDNNDGSITDNDDDDHDANGNSNVSASANVDDDSDDEDAAERDCICLNKSFDVPKIAGLCASCIAQNLPRNDDDDDDDDDDRDGLEDINKIMRQCGFPATTIYAPEATTAVTSIVVSATRPAVTGGGGGATTTTTSPTSTPTPAVGLVSGGDSVHVNGYAAAAGVGAAGALALTFAWA